jgi:hypothetical protein
MPAARMKFLTGLHDGCEGVCELRALPSEARTFVSPGDEPAIERFASARASENLYIAIATRRDTTSGRLENCLHLAALFVDIDFKNISPEQARARLARFPLSPSAPARRRRSW